MRLKTRNLFVRPQAHVISVESAEDGQTLRLQVDGMVCDV